jgi:hypothetical protein
MKDKQADSVPVRGYMEAHELIKELLEGKTLYRIHKFGSEDESDFEVETLVCEKGKDDIHFYTYGWGSALGYPEDRVIHLLAHPEQWTINNPVIPQP